MAVIEPKHNLMLILLSKLSGNETTEEIYDKTRFAWRTNLDRASGVDYVIAHNSEEKILAIFKPLSWLKGDDPAFEVLNKGLHAGRIGFIGQEAEESIAEEYFTQTTPPRKKGAANPIRYISVGDYASDHEEHDTEDHAEDTDGTNRRTYLAGLSLDDDEFATVATAVYDFADATYYKFSKNSSIYLIGLKTSPQSKFTLEAKNFNLVEVFEGTSARDDPEPSKNQIEQILKDNDSLTFFDENYEKVWFLFDYPEEDEEELEDPGDHWRYDFQQLANLLGDFVLIGFNSEIKDDIWQEWSGGHYDEGALSNSESVDHYSGDNLQSQHFVAKEIFNLLK